MSSPEDLLEGNRLTRERLAWNSGDARHPGSAWPEKRLPGPRSANKGDRARRQKPMAHVCVTSNSTEVHSNLNHLQSHSTYITLNLILMLNYNVHEKKNICTNIYENIYGMVF